jgi:hypothetical protein
MEEDLVVDLEGVFSFYTIRKLDLQPTLVRKISAKQSPLRSRKELE